MPRKKLDDTASPQCKTCQSPERSRIELLILGGGSQRAIALKFNLSKDSISRHMSGHVSIERRTALTVGAPIRNAVLAARLNEESASVLDSFKLTRLGLLTAFDVALSAGDSHTLVAVARELNCTNLNIAKVTGELMPFAQQQNVPLPGEKIPTLGDFWDSVSFVAAPPPRKLEAAIPPLLAPIATVSLAARNAAADEDAKFRNRRIFVQT